jgi:hypothetical protein
MQVVNDYERDVFNGDLGVITGISKERADARPRRCGREQCRLHRTCAKPFPAYERIGVGAGVGGLGTSYVRRSVWDDRSATFHRPMCTRPWRSGSAAALYRSGPPVSPNRWIGGHRVPGA